MNSRRRKKLEKRRREPIHKMLDMVLDINGLGKRDRAYTGNLPTAFFDFSGHIGAVMIHVYPHGWSCSADRGKDIYVHTYKPDRLKDAVRDMEAIKAETPAAGTARESM